MIKWRANVLYGTVWASCKEVKEEEQISNNFQQNVWFFYEYGRVSLFLLLPLTDTSKEYTCFYIQMRKTTMLQMIARLNYFHSFKKSVRLKYILINLICLW